MDHYGQSPGDKRKKRKMRNICGLRPAGQAQNKKIQSQYMCLLHITQYLESPVWVLHAAIANTFKDAGAVKSHN